MVEETKKNPEIKSILKDTIIERVVGVDKGLIDNTQQNKEPFRVLNAKSEPKKKLD